MPWWNYFLSILRSGYKEFESQISNASTRRAKTDLVTRTILDQSGDFALSDITAQAGAISLQLIKKVLGELKAEGRIQLAGRGRGARWRILNH